jgi:AraC-like DNA-binding protein
MNSDTIKIWRAPIDFGGMELRHGIGDARPVPRHWHDEFQFCFIEAGSGELNYRGTSYPTPSDSLFLVHPGEVHSNRPFSRAGCSYRTIFVSPNTVSRAATQIAGRRRDVPFFPTTVVYDRDTHEMFLRVHQAFENPASRLERESLLMDLLIRLISLYSEERSLEDGAEGREDTAIARVRDYLIEHYWKNVSLAELSNLASLSPYHLSRVFSSRVGLPPHAFQTQVRVNRAKLLLDVGSPISRAATETGFADQSHLTRHFKRVTGITPGQYLRSSKNVLYPAAG